MRFIGSKTNMVTSIGKLLNKHVDGSENIFVDLFAGTNIVGQHFKKQYTVYTNDLLYFSYANAKALIENNEQLRFSALKKQGILTPLDFLQENAERHLTSENIGYYENNYSPTGEAMYFTKENAKRIDYIREKIDHWKSSQLITDYEYYYLVSVLIEAIPFISNITGTYGAFLKHWDQRALNRLELRPLEVLNNHKRNKSFNIDSNELIKNIKADIVYIDTPYNNRQYAPNYHVLENVARNDKPDLFGKTKLFEWQHLKSKYSSKNDAYKVMSDLIREIDARHVILSYNNEGIIEKEKLKRLLIDNSCDGKVDIVKVPFRKYKSKVKSKNDDLYEILFYFKKKDVGKRLGRNLVQSKSNTKWICSKKQYIKSPLNYIGGKYRLLDRIIPLFPENINCFVDLFSGGANVGINVDAKNIVFNDMNIKINEMFRFFSKSDIDELVFTIKQRIAEYGLTKTNEKAYLEFRRAYNSTPNPLDLYILAAYSYNYQFRFNNSMEFNNPFGRNRSSFSANMEENLRKFVKRLQSIDAKFTDSYFDEFDFDSLNEDDFVYMDPPYLVTTGSYNDGNRGFKDWGVQEEMKLYEVMQKLTGRSIKYALSNVIENKGNTNEFLKKFVASEPVYVHYFNHNYNNASYNSKGKGSIEVLVTNYKP